MRRAVVAIALVACGGPQARRELGVTDLEHTERPPESIGAVDFLVAWRANERGIGLAKQARYAEATRAFQEAVSLLGDNVPAYAFNRCMSLYLEGDLASALGACKLVTPTYATPQQQAKRDALVARIRARARAQGTPLAE